MTKSISALLVATLMTPLSLFAEIEFIDGGPTGMVQLRDTSKSESKDYFINSNQIVSVELHTQAPELEPIARLTIYTTQIRAGESVSYSILFSTRKEAETVAAKITGIIGNAEQGAADQEPARRESKAK